VFWWVRKRRRILLVIHQFHQRPDEGTKEYAMTQTTVTTKKVPAPESLDAEVVQFRAQFDQKSPLDEIVRRGAQEMLQTAIEAEVDQFVEEHASKRDEAGRRLVVRNGHLPAREIMTGAGALEIQQPRARDNDPDPSHRTGFSPSIIPQYMRKSPSLEEMIPVLYLLGVSTGDFAEALEALVGEQAKGFSANTVVRLKEKWTTEHEEWSQRSLANKQYVYVWADGIHVNVRLGDEEHRRQCILVLMGATADGRKELIAVQDGYRESEQSWSELMLDVKQRGLEKAPELAIGDGALGFWAALRKVFPSTREQRCWVHKTANILNDIPKATQPRVKQALHEIWEAETKQAAEKALQHFKEKFEAKYPKAWERLEKDRDVLLSFYDFPAEHWRHIRTTNPIESAFATIRLRHRRTKGSGSRRTSLAMMFKLGTHAEKRWRRLNGHQQIIHLLKGKIFIDGIMQDAA
jgi:transposase-like protein